MRACRRWAWLALWTLVTVSVSPTQPVTVQDSVFDPALSASENLDRILSLRPYRTHAWVRTELQKLAKEHRQAKEHPVDLVIQYWIAAAFQEEMKFEPSEKILQALAEECKQVPDAPPWLVPWVHLRLGWVAERNGDGPKAITCFLKVLQSDWIDASARKYAAEGLTRLGRPTRPTQCLTVEQMQSDLKQLAETIARVWGVRKKSNEAVRQQVEDIAERKLRLLNSGCTRERFSQILYEIVAELGDGHCGIVDGATSFGDADFKLPFRYVATEDGLIVAGFERGRSIPDVCIGDKIIAIGGWATEAALRRLEAMIPASTEHSRRFLAVRALGHRPEAATECVLERPDGRVVAVGVPNVQISPAVPMHESKLLDNAIGYLRISTFEPTPADGTHAPTNAMTTEDVRKLKQAANHAAQSCIDEPMKGLLATKSLIVDLRGNRGGVGLLAIRLTQYFIEPDARKRFRFCATVVRNSPDLERLAEQGRLADLELDKNDSWTQSKQHTEMAEDAPYYGGRLIILVDEGCSSTTELFLAGIKQARPTALLVGRRTAGSVGLAMPMANLKHSGAEPYVSVGHSSAGGQSIEGEGIAPDIAVVWTREDVLKSRDPFLEAALREARRP